MAKTEDQEVDVQLDGSEERVREMLAGLHEVAQVAKVEGPFRRDDGRGVQVRAVAIPRQRAADPGE